jgi:MFS family permease
MFLHYNTLMDRNIKLLSYHNFLTDFKLYSAILVIYFVRITGSYLLAMSLFSAVMAVAAIAEIPTGVYSDKIGRRNTLIMGSICAFLASVFYAVGQSYGNLFIGSCFAGLARAWYSGNNNALLYDTLASSGKRESYSHYLGRTSTMFQIALTSSALLGSIIASWSFPLIMWISVVPQVLCIGVSLLVTEPRRRDRGSGNVYEHLRNSVHLILRNRLARLVSLQDIIGFGINEATFEFRSAFIATLWPIWAVGVSKMLSYAGAAFSFWTSGRVIKKIGLEQAVFIPRLYGRIIGVVAYGIPSVLSPILLASTSLLYGTVSVAGDTLLQKNFTGKERATASSLVSLAGSVFFGVFSLLLGFLADTTTPSLALLMAEVMTASTIYITWKITRMATIPS